MSNEIVVKAETGLATFDAELAAFAQEAAANEVVQSHTLSVKSGVLKLDGNKVEGNKFKCIILTSGYVNKYFEGKYDPDNKAPPVCFGLCKTEQGMSPHENSTKPQAPKCANCPKNQFKSADNGVGKACKNQRRFVFIPGDVETPDDVAASEAGKMELPVTSGKHLTNFVKALATRRLPTFAVVAEVAPTPHDKHQFEVKFSAVSEVPKELLPALLAKAKSVDDVLLQGYPKVEEIVAAVAEPDAPAAPAKKKKF